MQQLIQLGLIDEYQLFIEPIILGGGRVLFNLGDRQQLKLIRTKAFQRGAVVLYYQPVEAKGKGSP